MEREIEKETQFDDKIPQSASSQINFSYYFPKNNELYNKDSIYKESEQKNNEKTVKNGIFNKYDQRNKVSNYPENKVINDDNSIYALDSNSQYQFREINCELGEIHKNCNLRKKGQNQNININFQKEETNNKLKKIIINPNKHMMKSTENNQTPKFNTRFKKINSRRLQNKEITRNSTNDAKFFIIKSVDEDNIHKSIKYGIWCSTPRGNQKLNKAFKEAEGNYPIYLFFSVNGSGRFLGVSQMMSEFDCNANFNYWSHSHKWKGYFSVSWLIIKDLPNKLFNKLNNELNQGKQVTSSRDTQEIDIRSGMEMLRLFKDYNYESSILDDFDFYENKESLNQNRILNINKMHIINNSNNKIDIQTPPNSLIESEHEIICSNQNTNYNSNVSEEEIYKVDQEYKCVTTDKTNRSNPIIKFCKIKINNRIQPQYILMENNGRIKRINEI